MLAPSPIPVPDERDEDARLRAMSSSERAAILSVVVRTAAHLLELNPARERVLSLPDPLPPSSEAHWARLRAQARAHRR